MIFRSIARKPVPMMETYLKYGFVITEHQCYCCPRCGKPLNAGPQFQPKYCSECGQHVDFKGVKWKKDRELGYSTMQRRDEYASVKD